MVYCKAYSRENTGKYINEKSKVTTNKNGEYKFSGLKNGKYIVFCKDREDMFDKIEHAKEIFGKVNSKINVDYVITKKGGEDTKGKTKTENDRTLEEFEICENGDGLNLLFCVDMLNEGVHLDGIDGEVLFDLTKFILRISPNYFYILYYSIKICKILSIFLFVSVLKTNCNKNTEIK